MKASNTENFLKKFNINITNDKQSLTFHDLDSFATIIFVLWVKNHNLENESISLYNGSGKLLSYFPIGNEPATLACEDFTLCNDAFFIFADPDSKRMQDIEMFQLSFSKLISAFYHNEHLRKFIFDGLDSLPNSICVYDKNLHLIYANSDFCQYLHISDRNSALGKHNLDILKQFGTQVTSVIKPHDHLKVNDVVKYGKPVVNWEVEVKKTNSPSDCMLASNDMYPIFDASGSVRGVAEISRSRNTNIKQVRDTLGLSADYTFEDIIGNSEVLSEIKKMSMTFASSPYNILIYGESGTGKELFAQSIHNHSIRRNKPFVAINCASISPELIDSELFGYESGAFTGAAKNGHIGKFELANGGTLFLDEVAELPLHAQTKLLRTLETHQITKIGGTKNITVDVRIIAATNRSLETMIEEGLFREDLYYRLMVLNLTIPPLRERPEDIIPCCEFFLKQAMLINNSRSKSIDNSAKKLLLEYDWPGNVREVRNVINRVSVISNTNVITDKDLINAFRNNKNHRISSFAAKTPKELLLEKQTEINCAYASLLKDALILCNDNKTEAAKLLGCSRKTIYNLLEKYKEYL